MASKALLVLGLLLAAAALVSSEVIARELEDTYDKAAAKEAAGVMDPKYGGQPEVGYPVVVDPRRPSSPRGYPYLPRCPCCPRKYYGCICCMHAKDIPDP